MDSAKPGAQPGASGAQGRGAWLPCHSAEAGRQGRQLPHAPAEQPGPCLQHLGLLLGPLHLGRLLVQEALRDAGAGLIGTDQQLPQLLRSTEAQRAGSLLCGAQTEHPAVPVLCCCPGRCPHPGHC